MAKRPPAVWLTQILMVFGSLICLFALVTIFPSPGRLAEGSRVATLMMYNFLDLGFLALFVVAFRGLAKRRSYGRWLGLVLLGLLWLSLANSYLHPRPPAYKILEYKNEQQRQGGEFTAAAMPILLSILILRMAFAKRVKAYFDSTIHPA